MPAKILLFIILLLCIASCNSVKRVPDGKNLLTENKFVINGKDTTAARINNIPYQKPNSKIPLLGLPTRLYIYNWARPNIDSILQARLIEDDNKRKLWTAVLSRKQLDKYIAFRENFNQTIKNTGEPPSIISENLAERSTERLEEYYHSYGWFNAKASYDIERDSLSKKGSITYTIDTKSPYYIDSLKTFIKSPQVDSIYKKYESASLINKGKQYKLLDINAETTRLTTLFRNKGVYHFDRDYINFIGDSVNTGNKVNLELNIKNRQVTRNDSVFEENLKVHRISKVNVYTDYAYSKRNDTPQDTIQFDDYNLYAFDKIGYKPRYLTEAIFINSGDLYSDEDRNKSLIRISQLRTFRYPDLRYTEDPNDPDGTDLIANLHLTPLPKFNLKANFDVLTSNIQKVGIGGSGSLLIRNVFGGLETLQLSGRASIGASYDNGNNNAFFDITELGADISLNIPRIFFPIRTSGFIKPEMSPSTSFSIGLGTQNNIGLDKQNLTGGINYSWNPTSKLNYKFDLFDIQYVRNLNSNNYFNVYRNSFSNLNDIAVDNLAASNPLFDQTNEDEVVLRIPEGASDFITQVENGSIDVTSDEFDEVSSIEERRERLTEDNLILATAFTYFKNTRTGIFDDDYTSFRVKLELAGNLLDVISSLGNFQRDAQGNSKVVGVTFSQYAKTEIDFINHWDFGNDNILAVRAFGGIAIPYGNSNSIPFIRSFFGGGSNDNRAWQAYRLGPGRTDSPNDFNEANMKLAFNAEQRFQVLGDLKGAIFIDVGNIWNVLDNVDDPAATFTGFKSLKDIAVGSGFGLRYDFNFFVLRFDIGFKTYNPARSEGNRWFREYNFANSVLNVGINYPF